MILELLSSGFDVWEAKRAPHARQVTGSATAMSTRRDSAASRPDDDSALLADEPEWLREAAVTLANERVALVAAASCDGGRSRRLNPNSGASVIGHHPSEALGATPVAGQTSFLVTSASEVGANVSAASNVWHTVHPAEAPSTVGS